MRARMGLVAGVVVLLSGSGGLAGQASPGGMIAYRPDPDADAAR